MVVKRYLDNRAYSDSLEMAKLDKKGFDKYHEISPGEFEVDESDYDAPTQNDLWPLFQSEEEHRELVKTSGLLDCDEARINEILEGDSLSRLEPLRRRFVRI